MAYPISSEALRLFKESYRQIVDIKFNGVRDTLTLSEEDVVAGGLSINRYSVSGSKIEIGSAVAAELSLILDNADGKFNEIMFEGAELYVRIGTKKWDARRWENAQYQYIPFGYFTIDEAPRKLEKITLTALDRMVMFDKPVDNTKIVFPLSVADLLDRVCTICRVSLGIDATKLTNADYIINEAPTDDDLTYRQYIAWIAEITGTCAFIDWNGKLILKWYEDTDTEINLSDRYSSDLQENAITISGVQVVFGEEEHLVGNASYAFNVESNSLIQHDPLVIAEGLFGKLYGFSYTPFTAKVKPMPHLYPMDKVLFVDKLGVAHSTIITDCTFTLNNSMAIEGKGETAAKNGYASMNPLTARERAILSKVKNELDNTISSRAQALLELNETICNSIGLRMTVVSTDGEGDIYYFHNNKTLEDSSIIYTFKSGGFAWTHDWNDGEPVWEYGFTQDGNAVFNALSTYKIQTQYLDAGCVTAEKIAVAYKNSVSSEIAGTATTLRQEFKAADGVLKSFIETNYSTSSSVSSQIKQTSDSIMTEVNKKVNDSEFGTKITQNYSSVRIAWNSISKYIEFAGGAINIYSSTNQGSDDLLCKMTYTGTWYYHNGTTIGKIGTNNFVDESNFKGLVFDLEAEAKYMCWAAMDKASDSTYTVKLIYYNDNSKSKKGLHFGCNTYADGNLYLTDSYRFINYTGGGVGYAGEMSWVNGSNNTAVSIDGTSKAFKVFNDVFFDIYTNIDLHNFDILNQSDARLKKNIKPTKVNALDFISQVEMKEFDWIENEEHCDLGVIAQQLQEVAPHLVDENKETGKLSIKINKFIPYLIKAVQELSAMVDKGGHSPKPHKWVDPYKEADKQLIVAANTPKDKHTPKEHEPIKIPVKHGKGAK